MNNDINDTIKLFSQNLPVIMNNLSSNVINSSKNLCESINSAQKNMRDSLDNLSNVIRESSEQSDKQAKAMNRLTFALVVIGVINVLVIVFQTYQH
jgi:CHASE3 domain sensor protein